MIDIYFASTDGTVLGSKINDPKFIGDNVGAQMLGSMLLRDGYIVIVDREPDSSITDLNLKVLVRTLTQILVEVYIPMEMEVEKTNDDTNVQKEIRMYLPKMAASVYEQAQIQQILYTITDESETFNGYSISIINV
jgi:hypothetical protein